MQNWRHSCCVDAFLIFKMEVESTKTETGSPVGEENCLNTTAVNLSGMEEDVDIEHAVDQFQKTILSQPVYNERRRSIFNTTLEINEPAPSVCQVADAAIEAVEEKVEQEKVHWDKFIKESKRRDPDNAAYKPSAEQLAYLSQGPDLQSYIRGMGTFMNEGNAFMQQFEEMCELQESLQDICECHVVNEQRINIAECLAERSDTS